MSYKHAQVAASCFGLGAAPVPLPAGPSCANPFPLALRCRGLRCLFGDQSLFVRAADFRRVGGYNERWPLMEDLDLILRMHMAGGTRGGLGDKTGKSGRKRRGWRRAER